MRSPPAGSAHPAVPGGGFQPRGDRPVVRSPVVRSPRSGLAERSKRRATLRALPWPKRACAVRFPAAHSADGYLGLKDGDLPVLPTPRGAPAKVCSQAGLPAPGSTAGWAFPAVKVHSQGQWRFPAASPVTAAGAASDSHRFPYYPRGPGSSWMDRGPIFPDGANGVKARQDLRANSGRRLCREL